MLLRESQTKKLHRKYLIFFVALITVTFYVFQTRKFSVFTEERLIINEDIIHDLDLTVRISSDKDLPRVTFFDVESARKSFNTTIPEISDVKSKKYLELSGAGSRPIRRLPDALVIGVKKCGTRALLEFLRIHPDIRAAGSEVHFFDKHYNKGFEWYRGRMPSTVEGQVTMEKTPSYFVTREAPARVHKMNPAVKLLLVVRDPVTRAVSDYTQAASKRKVSEFEKLVFVGETRVVDTGWSPVRLGLYCHYLTPWLSLFNLSQMLFVSGERLISDPAAQLAQVQDFLGLKRVVTEKHFYWNATKGFPCLLKSERRATPHCLGKNKGRSHPPINASVLTALTSFYRPFNARFYKLTGVDFGWQ